jgi:hypothetical protein
VISYDYSGYGHSEGYPSEEGTFTDIEQVIDFVNLDKGVKFGNIVL